MFIHSVMQIVLTDTSLFVEYKTSKGWLVTSVSEQLTSVQNFVVYSVDLGLGFSGLLNIVQSGVFKNLSLSVTVGAAELWAVWKPEHFVLEN